MTAAGYFLFLAESDVLMFEELDHIQVHYRVRTSS